MRHIYLLLIVSTFALSGLMGTGDLQVKFKNNPHAVYYFLLQHYHKLYRELCFFAQAPDAYATEASKTGIQQMVDLLAQFAEQNAKKRTKILIDKTAVYIPYIAGSATKQDLGWMLFEHAVKQGNEVGIRFLKKTYDLDLNTGTSQVRCALQWVGEGNGYEQKPTDTIKLLFELGLDKKYINAWDAEGQAVIHRAAQHLVQNHIGLQDPEAAFEAQLKTGALHLPKDATKEEELKYYIQAREEEIREWEAVIRLLCSYGADMTIKNNDEKSAREIIHNCPCMGEDGECKKSREAKAAEAQAAKKAQS